MSNKFARELLILVLLIVVILFTIGILFYDCLPLNSNRIKSNEYMADDEIQRILREVQDNSDITVDGEEDDSLLKSYSVTEDDLTAYPSDKEYESGKKDPFAENAEPIQEQTNISTTSVTQKNVQSGNKIVNNDNKNKTADDFVNKTNTVTSEKNKTNEITEKQNNINQNKTIRDNNIKDDKTNEATKRENQTSSKKETKENEKKASNTTTGTFFESKNSK